MGDTMDEVREDLAAMLEDDGSYFVGAEAGDGTPSRYRGPTSASQAVETAIAWARGAFAGSELSIAEDDDGAAGSDVVTIEAGEHGEVPSIAGGSRKPARKPAAKRARKPKESAS